MNSFLTMKAQTADPLPGDSTQSPHLAHLTRLTSLTLLALLAAFAVGCTVLSYRSPQGERFSRVAFGSTTSLSSLVVEADTNGVRRVELRGYANDNTQALGVVTEAAVRAALQK